jgi:hypothetical protein
VFFCPLGVKMNFVMTSATDPHKNRSIIKPATATKGKAMMNVNARTSAANNLANGMGGNIFPLKATVNGKFMLSFFGDASKGCAAYHCFSTNLVQPE